MNFGGGVASLDHNSAATMFWPLTSYEAIRTTSVVPITLIEFRPLAAFMPLAFARSGATIYAIALIGFPGLENLVFSGTEPTALPLLLRSFPLALGPKDGHGRPSIAISESPQGELGGGQPAFLPDGSLHPLLAEKADALWFYAKARDDDVAALHDLDTVGALETWPLELVFEDGSLPISELLRVRADFLQSKDYLGYLATQGPKAAIALHYHRMSLSAIDRLAGFEPLAMKSV